MPHTAQAKLPELAELLSLETLQELQDAITAVTRLNTHILHVNGTPLTHPTDLTRRIESDLFFSNLIIEDNDPELGEHNLYSVPIHVRHRPIGMISLQPSEELQSTGREDFKNWLKGVELTTDQQEQAIELAKNAFGINAGSIVQFTHLIADALGRIGNQQVDLNQRLEELNLLFQIATLLTGHGELKELLTEATKGIAQVMQAKGVNIRFLEKNAFGKQELVSRATYGLDESYANLGRNLINKSELTRTCIDGEAVNISDLLNDPRVFFPEDAKRMNLRSMLSYRIAYKEETIGTIQVYSGIKNAFDDTHVHLLKAIAKLLAVAIQNLRLDHSRKQHERLQRSVALASDVQKRMIPKNPKNIDGFDIAASYTPSQELGGDFYEYLSIKNRPLSFVLGDVVGKGVAAALLMAGIRTNFKAFATLSNDVTKIMGYCNNAMNEDTLPSEFATVFLGSIDANNVLHYCSAGHEPTFIVRDGEIYELTEGGMIIGVMSNLSYLKGTWEFKSGDLMLVYSDGLPDAANECDDRLEIDTVKNILLNCHTKNMTADETLNAIKTRQGEFIGARQLVDDTTLIAIRIP